MLKELQSCPWQLRATDCPKTAPLAHIQATLGALRSMLLHRRSLQPCACGPLCSTRAWDASRRCLARLHELRLPGMEQSLQQQDAAEALLPGVNVLEEYGS